MSSNLSVGFLGSGKMALALARGFLKGDAVKMPQKIRAACPKQDQHLLEGFRTLGCATMHDNRDLVENSDVVVLAVKPNVVQRVLNEVKPVLGEKALFSVAAGVPIKQLEGKLNGSKSKIIRVMPNTPCTIQKGATVFTCNAGSTHAEAQIAHKLFQTVGLCYEVPEAFIDAITAISGSGPAYMYMMIEAMADGAVKQGLPRDLALQLAAQTMIGAGSMILETHQHPAVLKDQVTSPSGTTITALDVLEKSGVRAAVMQAVEAATNRSVQLSVEMVQAQK